MKFHLLSDVHLEFGKWSKRVDVNAIDADVTVLAGDIGVGLTDWPLLIVCDPERGISDSEVQNRIRRFLKRKGDTV